MEQLSSVAVLTLGVIAMVAGYKDIRTRTIPNWLPLLTVAAGLLLQFLRQGPSGLAQSLGAGSIGFALMISIYCLRVVGGGDVKLFAAFCFWFEPIDVLGVARWIGLCGGALALLWALLTALKARPRGEGLPYGVAIGCGAFGAYLSGLS